MGLRALGDSIREEDPLIATLTTAAAASVAAANERSAALNAAPVRYLVITPSTPRRCGAQPLAPRCLPACSLQPCVCSLPPYCVCAVACHPTRRPRRLCSPSGRREH